MAEKTLLNMKKIYAGEYSEDMMMIWLNDSVEMKNSIRRENGIILLGTLGNSED